MPLTYTNTHTHSLRTDATGPDLATSFPWGNIRRHQLSGAHLLCFPVLPSCPSPHHLLSAPPLSFIHSFLPSFFLHQSHKLVILSFLLYLFNHRHLSRNVPFMWDKLSLCGLNVTKCQLVVLIMVCVWLHVCAAMRLDSSSQDCWAMKRVMMHTTSCIYTHQAHKYHHSHRLGPSTWSHSLGLRGRGEHGQSWQELLVCVCACVWGGGAVCQGLYLQSVDLSL